MWTNEKIVAMLEKNGFQTEYSDEVVVITNEDDLQVTLIIQDDQILTETILAPASEIQDIAAFNDAILKVHHKLFPLTAIAINQLNGADYYIAFGAISSKSSDETLLIEVETLFDNVINMLDVFKAYFAIK